jgi:hypothetical protein
VNFPLSSQIYFFSLIIQHPIAYHQYTTNNAMDGPTSPQYRNKKPIAPILILSPKQDTAEPTSHSPKEMRQQCRCCCCDGVDDVINDGTTRSCGHPLCSSCLHQLEMGADESSHQAPVVCANLDGSPYESQNKDAGESSNRAQVVHKKADQPSQIMSDLYLNHEFPRDSVGDI